MAVDVSLAFQGDADPRTRSYLVQFTLNGQPSGGGFSVPRTAGYSYTVLLSQANPGVTLNDGDVVGCNVTAVDAADNITSTPLVVPSITISIAHPPPPKPNLLPPPVSGILSQV